MALLLTDVLFWCAGRRAPGWFSRAPVHSKIDKYSDAVGLEGLPVSRKRLDVSPKGPVSIKSDQQLTTEEEPKDPIIVSLRAPQMQMASGLIWP